MSQKGKILPEARIENAAVFSPQRVPKDYRSSPVLDVAKKPGDPKDGKRNAPVRRVRSG